MTLISLDFVSASTQQTFPDLPTELVLHILRIFAASSKSSCLSLCLVSSWAHHLAVPYLLSNVIITTPSQGQSFCSFVARTDHGAGVEGDPLFYVRSLWWMASQVDLGPGTFSSCESLHYIAGHCDLLQRIAPPSPGGTAARKRDLHVTLFGGLRTMLSSTTSSAGISSTPESPSILDRITHLYLVGERPCPIGRLPRLTHLAIYYNHSHSFLRSLEALVLPVESLEMLVLVIDLRIIPTIRMLAKRVIGRCREKDKRVFFVEADLLQLRAEWEEEVRGGESVWERAAYQTMMREKLRTVQDRQPIQVSAIHKADSGKESDQRRRLCRG